ncbi:MAG: hypothetical protein MJA30_11525 [Cytophagales bacterium]|nr:hypothetical protein [Cytophagales bacterium]
MTSKPFNVLLEQMAEMLKKIGEHTLELKKQSKMLDQHSKMHPIHIQHAEKAYYALDKIIERLERLEDR